MNPMLSAAVGAVLRWGLAIGAGWLVQHGIWTQTEAASYVAALTLGLLSLGWSLWNKYLGRQRLLTALTLAPGLTENELDALITAGTPTPPVTTPANAVPEPQK